jgi:hypothetical protein
VPDSTNPIPLPESADDPALMRERYDLDPEPTLQPAVQDVLEGVADALDRAVDPGAPALTTARVRTISTRVQAAASGHVTADELLLSLRLLIQDWRA